MIRSRRTAVRVLHVVALCAVGGLIATGATAAQTAGPVDLQPADLPGSGTQDDPYVISNASELQTIADARDAHYRLSDDINATATATWHDGRGFDPIGTENGRFTGTFDGNGHTITELTVDRPNSDAAGLFGYTGQGGVVRAITLTNATITGGPRVGGVAGFNGGLITESAVTGHISGTEFTGGVVGYNAGTLNRTTSDGRVSGRSFTGGLAGMNFKGAIHNASAAATVNGTETVGGLVGINFQGEINSTFATGSVTGTTNVGGLVGRTSGGSIAASYWDTEATGQSTSAGDATGLTTTQMTGGAAKSNMPGLAFGTAWQTQSDDYPKLGGGSSGLLPGFGVPAVLAALLLFGYVAHKKRRLK